MGMINKTTAQVNTLLDKVGEHTTKIETLEEDVHFLKPSQIGEEGQVLTLNGNLTPVWDTPKAAFEIVTVQLTTQDGQGDVSGVTVTVNVEGETEARLLTTDADGRCTFKVSQGLEYIMSFSEIEGYKTVDNMTVRAALPQRYITVTYNIDTSATMEHVVVNVKYGGTGPGTKATTLAVTSDGVTSTYYFVGDRCEFDVERGKTYRIDFQEVEGYVKPASKNYLASWAVRSVGGVYIGVISGIGWVKKDGTFIELIEARAEDKENLAGLYVGTAALVNAHSAFIVPMEYLLGEITIGTKSWCNSQVQFDCIGNYTSAAAATTDDGANFNGEANTVAVLEEANSRGLTVAAFTACTAVTYEIAGVTKNGFLGSYMQMKTFSDNIGTIDSICTSVFGVPCIRVNVGTWWCSTQYSATNAVDLNLGGFNDYGNKTGSYSVVPFLAY